MTGPEGFTDLAEQMDAAIERGDDSAVMDLARRMDRAGHEPHLEGAFREILTASGAARPIRTAPHRN